MGPSQDYADRRRREADFHDRWASDIDPHKTLVDETFTSTTAVENQYILDVLGDLRDKRVLDYGCGAAEGAIYFAKQGARAVAVDVSPGMLQAAERLAAHHGVEIETRLVTSDALPAGDGEFDFVYGNGVLHHVDLQRVRPELARIMRPGAKACFIEPLTYNPVIEAYRRMAETVRTPDERPLKFPDIDAFREFFHVVEHREFWLLTLAVFVKFFVVDRVHPSHDRYWKRIYTHHRELEWFFRPLKRLDDTLLAAAPPLRRLCWTTVISLARPRDK